MVLPVDLKDVSISRGYPCQMLLNLSDVALKLGFANALELTGASLLLAFRRRPNFASNLLIVGTDNDALTLDPKGVIAYLSAEQTALLPAGSVYLDLIKTDGETLTPIPVSFSVVAYDPPAHATLNDYLATHELHPSQLDFSVPANSGLTLMGWS